MKSLSNNLMWSAVGFVIAILLLKGCETTVLPETYVIDSTIIDTQDRHVVFDSSKTDTVYKTSDTIYKDIKGDTIFLPTVCPCDSIREYTNYFSDSLMEITSKSKALGYLLGNDISYRFKNPIINTHTKEIIPGKLPLLYLGGSMSFSDTTTIKEFKLQMLLVNKKLHIWNFGNNIFAKQPNITVGYNIPIK